MTKIKRTFGTDEKGRHFCELRADLPETDPGFPAFIGLKVYAGKGQNEPGIQAIAVGERSIMATLQQRAEGVF